MRYSVKVKLGSDSLVVDGDKITAGIKAKPEGGKANDELIRKLSRRFGVPASSIRIVRGKTSRNKIVEISGG